LNQPLENRPGGASVALQVLQAGMVAVATPRADVSPPFGAARRIDRRIVFNPVNDLEKNAAANGTTRRKLI